MSLALADRRARSLPGAGWARLAFGLPVTGAAVAYALGARINPDSSWYLFATERWLDGATLYADIMEINPPLAFYLTAPVILSNKATGIAATLLFPLWAIALAALSSFLTARVLDRAAAPSTARTARWHWPAATLLLLFVPLQQFGQREHLMLIFAMPWLTLTAFGGDDQVSARTGRVALAGFACIGLLLKPHFMLAPAAIAVAEAVRTRSWRKLVTAEMLVFAGAGAAYIVFVATVHPAYFAAVVPLALVGYGGYDAPLGALLLTPASLATLLVATLVAVSAARSGTALRPARVLAVAAGAFLAAFVIQAKGWGYQALPAFVAASLAGVALATAPGGRGRPILVAGALSPLGAALLLAALAFPASRTSDGSGMQAAVGRLVRERTYMALSADLTQQFPFVTEAGAIYVSRYPSLWPLPGALRGLAASDAETRQAARRTIATLRAEIADDLARGKPDYVLVQTADGRAFLPTGFDPVAFFSAEPGFAAEWSRYRRVHAAQGYDLYQRQTSAPSTNPAGS